MGNDIQIIGASENNLKRIDVAVPKGKLVLFAGVSGSGKSSLAFDTIARESARVWQESYPLYLRTKMPHYERPAVDEMRNLAPAIVVDQKPLGASDRSTVGTATDVAPLVRLLFSRVGVPSAGGSMAYSPNSPTGACPECSGLGEVLELDEDSLFDKDRSLAEGAIAFSQFSVGWQSRLYQDNGVLDPDKPLTDYTSAEWDFLVEGPAGAPPKVEIRSNNTGRVDKVDYEGVIPRFRRLYLNRDIKKLRTSLQEEILSHVRRGACPACGGSGLNPEALKTKVLGMSIVEMMEEPAEDLLGLLSELDDPWGASLARQISSYLRRMCDVGVGYLSLARRTNSISGGEAQRLKMVRHLGSPLSDITYVLDEPTAGLHPADAEKIGRMLEELRDRHNNVLVVEHSRQILERSDQIIEMGPGAGEQGGEIVYQGDVEGLLAARTPTARALSTPLAVKCDPLPWHDVLKIRDAHGHNLRHIDVDVPLGVLVAVTGVAGSGKSTIACLEVPRAYPKAIVIDQRPLGTSVRSTPATYTGAMDEIRKVFAAANGVSPAWFSFNSKGACPVCKGKGNVSYEMAFADPVVVTCEECGGKRYNPTALSYTYQGIDIDGAMRLTVEQAIPLFDNGRITRVLAPLKDVGLGYLSLGQPTSTLSGGEVQRVKLASELSREGRVYVLDEPSSGLSTSDAEMLLALLRRMVLGGNSVLMVEHRMELIAQADWIIDMGPEGGARGGEVVFAGTPEQLLASKTSKTGEWLRRFQQR
ncbi:excinuclease ABC subunit UvrA [Adlercreutzia equolifaciens]|uniref:excinuclease ABC subunit UvrA n=1 Tax=Adlercreutzia equolifaciens TaxID=446660 RepID=UPI00242F17C5|nr:excinuclease ABC subunit UvrA [Adlercreutzia equolifaciens]